jgi:hypothetical protein
MQSSHHPAPYLAVVGLGFRRCTVVAGITMALKAPDLHRPDLSVHSSSRPWRPARR